MARGNPAPVRMWKEGQSGNPSGRPKTLVLTTELKRRLNEVDPESGLTVAEILSGYWVERALRGHFKAFELICAYVDGRPRETIALQGDLEVQTKVEFYLPSNGREVIEDTSETIGAEVEYIESAEENHAD